MEGAAVRLRAARRRPPAQGSDHRALRGAGRRRGRRPHRPFPRGRGAAGVDAPGDQPRQLRARRRPGRALGGRAEAGVLRHAGRARVANMMRIARYRGEDGEILEGVVQGDEIEEISGLDGMLQGGRRLGRRRKIADLQLLPWGLARKIVGVGKNYVDHAKELASEVPKEPLLLIKPTSALIGHGQPIVLPPQSVSKEVHHESELAVVIGKRLRRASEAECAKAVAGVTCLNDVTARDIQRAEGQWTRAKGFDTFCPIGPWVTVGLDWSDLRVVCRVNGKVKQDGRTGDQIFPVPRLLAFISAGMTLEPGDVVTTGTPDGVGPIQAGDTVEIEVEGVGVLRNPVVKAG